MFTGCSDSSSTASSCSCSYSLGVQSINFSDVSQLGYIFDCTIILIEWFSFWWGTRAELLGCDLCSIEGVTYMLFQRSTRATSGIQYFDAPHPSESASFGISPPTVPVWDHDRFIFCVSCLCGQLENDSRRFRYQGYPSCPNATILEKNVRTYAAERSCCILPFGDNISISTQAFPNSISWYS